MELRHGDTLIASANVTGDTLPIGTIVEYSGTTVPDGWEASVLRNIITCKLALNQTTVATTYTLIPIIQSVVSGTKLSVENGKIKIGAGVTKIMVSAFVQYQRFNNGVWVFKTQRNRSEVVVDIGISAYNLVAAENTVIVPTIIYEVRENDLIQLVYYDSVANNSVRADGTYLTVEVIEW